MITTLLFAAALTWMPLEKQKAGLCEVSLGQSCLTELSEPVKAQLPATQQDLLTTLGRQGAMALPIYDNEVAGIIMINSAAIPQYQSAMWGGEYYQLPLKQQRTLTLWHELGHLVVQQYQGSILPKQINGYQHEWLADCYLVWRVAREYGSFELAWQQYHRRNLAVIDNIDNMSHWSVPILQQILMQRSVEELAGFSSFGDLLEEIYPDLKQLDTGVKGEFASLLHRTFSYSALQALPDYIFWRKSGLKNYLMPTLNNMMGKQKADRWSKQNLTHLNSDE